MQRLSRIIRAIGAEDDVEESMEESTEESMEESMEDSTKGLGGEEGLNEAQELAETWINGNLEDVVNALFEAGPVLAIEVYEALPHEDGLKLLDLLRLRITDASTAP